MRYIFILFILYSSTVFSDSVFIEKVTTSFDKPKVYQVIEQTFIDRGWRVAKHDGEGVMATINHRGVDATVTIYFSGQSLLYACKGTREVTRRKLSAGGGVKSASKAIIDYCPKKWVANLKSDLAWLLQDI